MHLSQHASKRSQQRAIPPLLIDLLLKFGSSYSAGDGTSKLFFDKTSRRHVRAYAGPLARLLDEHLDLYAVVDANSTIITVAHTGAFSGSMRPSLISLLDRVGINRWLGVGSCDALFTSARHLLQSSGIT